MRDCRTPESFYLYLEGELGPAERRAFEAHLAVCPGCREVLAERRLLHEAFTSLPPLDVPADLVASVMDAIPEPEAAGAKAAWLAPLASGLTALVVGLLGFYLLTGENLSDVLVALIKSLGSGFGRLLPFVAKLWKVAALLFDIASGFVSSLGKVLSAAPGFFRPEVLGLLAALCVGVSLLVVIGAKRLLSTGEKL